MIHTSLDAQPSSTFGARFWTALGLVVIAAALRLLPHLPNFSPVTAMALFAGAYFTRSSWAIAIPLAAMVLSDSVIGFHSLLPAVYGSFILVTLLGFALRERRGVLRIAGLAVTGSILFFVITNFAVWAQGGMYPQTPGGLSECFVAALPFLQTSVLGDLCYTGALFGVWALLEKSVPSLRTA
jgi:hypothetical protein